jgi:NAD(P)-dependent dehydrogenase (short-subunit alcohol dehydrogenase family)
MDGRLQGKVAIVTGAASGIGRTTAVRFAAEGASVVAADRNRAGAEETVAAIRTDGGEALFVQVDTSKSDQVSAMVESAVGEYGRLDVLINAAAILIVTGPIAEHSERDWDMMMAVNLKGVFLCCKYAIPAMLDSGGGSIVNIASGSGIQGAGRSTGYGVTKAGVIHLTTMASQQYASQGIRVNTVSPGPVDTPQFRGSAQSAERFQENEANHPMGRLAQPEEITNALLFLASDEASYISGENLIVDGGQIAGAVY